MSDSRPWARLCAVVMLFGLGSCASTAVMVDTSTGAAVETARAAEALAAADVVFLGENHASDAGHAAQLELVRLLHARRPALIVSMEMFERDVQPVLDAYLAGEIDEEQFLADSRPWPRYRDHYRGVVEYARAHGLPVVAANMPRKMAAQVAKEGPDGVLGSPHVARESAAPRDAYFERFAEAMRGHMGVDDDVDENDADAQAEAEAKLYRYYQSQCMKDDTMAESIVRAIHAHGGERPLVVHLCGKFHSDHGLGTLARVRQRDAGLRIASMSMQAMPDPRAEAVGLEDPPADFVLAVPPVTMRAPVARASSAAGAGAVRPADETVAVAEETAPAAPEEAPTSQPSAPEAAASAAPAPAGRPAGGRPALGFMPAYEADVDGVQVEMVTGGGAAAAAGIRAGDVIVELDGRAVLDMESYMQVLSSLTVGAPVQVVVQRGEEEHTLEARVGSR